VCEKMHARIPKATCIARQKANLEKHSNSIYLECVTCEQGEKIIMESIKLCKDCGLKPPISKNSPYCASCMAKRANEAKKAKKEAQNKIADGGTTQSIKKEKKSPESENTSLTIEFGKHVEVLKQTEKLAEDELRTVENQVIYILKSYISPETNKSTHLS